MLVCCRVPCLRLVADAHTRLAGLLSLCGALSWLLQVAAASRHTAHLMQHNPAWRMLHLLSQLKQAGLQDGTSAGLAGPSCRVSAVCHSMPHSRHACTLGSAATPGVGSPKWTQSRAAYILNPAEPGLMRPSCSAGAVHSWAKLQMRGLDARRHFPAWDAGGLPRPYLCGGLGRALPHHGGHRFSGCTAHWTARCSWPFSSHLC